MVRLAWIGMDGVCAAMVFVLARRLGRSLWPDERERADTLATVATCGYALYLPALSYAQFATSEIPALLAILLVLGLVTSSRATLLRFSAAGFTAGLACLARPSLLPLIVVVPLAATYRSLRADLLKVCAFVAIASLVIGACVLRNWSYARELTISTNSAYNLYIGNRDLYAEDLNLFHPRATLEQIEFRRQQWNETLPAVPDSPAEQQRLAMAWIREHPLLFLRRATGRLARVVVPKTDVLELLGGERQAGIFNASSLVLLGAANFQWAVILFGGLIGLSGLRHTSRDWSILMASVIVAATLLCLIAISKPRYSFVFDPLLIASASALWLDRRRTMACLTAIDRRVLAMEFGFIVWAWIAFVVFSFSSRAVL